MKTLEEKCQSTQKINTKKQKQTRNHILIFKNPMGILDSTKNMQELQSPGSKFLLKRSSSAHLQNCFTPNNDRRISNDTLENEDIDERSNYTKQLIQDDIVGPATVKHIKSKAVIEEDKMHEFFMAHGMKQSVGLRIP